MTTGQQPRMNARRLWLGLGGGILLLITGIGLVRLYGTPGVAPKVEEPTVNIPSPPPRVAVTALGRVEPQGEVVQVSGPVGDRIERLEVAEGDWVEARTVLAYLDSYEERLAERNLAAAQLVEAEDRLQAETAYRTAQIAEADTRIQQVNLPARHEIEAQVARIRQLESQLQLAQADLNRSQLLYQSGAIARQALDQQVTTFADLQQQLNNAQATLDRLNEAWNSNRRNAEAQLRSAEANLPLAQIQIAVESARQNLDLASARLERTVVRAPRAGRVLRILTHAGEAIPQGGGIVDLGDTRAMMVVAEVYETDVALVKVGQPAVITSRNGAFSDRLTGQVTAVGWQIFKNDVLDDDPAANADARVVEVQVQLDQPDVVAGLTNLQVDVRIDVTGS